VDDSAVDGVDDVAAGGEDVDDVDATSASPTSASSSSVPGPAVLPFGRNWNLLPPHSGHPPSICFEPSSNVRLQFVHWWGIGCGLVGWDAFGWEAVDGQFGIR
jgi:hypothetical protein